MSQATSMFTAGDYCEVLQVVLAGHVFHDITGIYYEDSVIYITV